MVDDEITAVVVTSPSPINPSTGHIEQVIDSIRYHLPVSEIVIVADGERGFLRPPYADYLSRLAWLCQHHYDGLLLVTMPDWQHQANCIRKALEFVSTPCVLMCEHDTPLTRDSIQWALLTAHLGTGGSQLIRFYHEIQIHPEHAHLMLDPEARMSFPMVRTIQWSQRPHLATTALYHRLLAEFFPPQSRGFVEDRMHGIVQDYYLRFGVPGWSQFGLWVYHPAGVIKRSEHLDSRAGAEKAPGWIACLTQD